MNDIVLTPAQVSQRMKALEGLLHHYLTDDRHDATKELSVAVSTHNQARVIFVQPPTKSEIITLIDHLKLVLKVTPVDRTRVTLDAINKVLTENGLPEISPSS
jgi:hypothetical protein